ncbi:MAG: hypothetical protein EOO75_14375 [Myxococcales bacterium]|nr:MAG: hypothetical protein EOO75_14375 [Myxococcales bacterium]
MTVIALDHGVRLRLEGIYDEFNHVLAFAPGTHHLHTLFADGSNNGGHFCINALDLDTLTVPPPGQEDDVEVEVSEDTLVESTFMLTMVHEPSGKRLLVHEAGSVAALNLATGRRKALIGKPPSEDDEEAFTSAQPVALFAVAAGGERVLAILAEVSEEGYPEEALLAPLGERFVVQLSETTKGRCLLRASLPNRWGQVDAGHARHGLALDPDGRRLLRAGGHTVRLYDLDRMAARYRRRPLVPLRGDVVRTWTTPRRVTQAVFLPDGEHVLAVCGRELVVWHVDHDEPVARWQGKRIVAWGVSTEGFVAVGDAGGGVRLGQLKGYRARLPLDSRSTGWSPWPFDAVNEG